ncbi:MAG: MFS transporter [Chloroflexi bacterium]|nr:MFS transporter [Chloroflexota bacterium]
MKELTSSPYRFVILGLILLAQGAFAINFMSAPPLFPIIMEDYGLARASASLMVSMPVLMMSLFSIPVGLLASHIGLKRTYALGAFLASAGTLTPLVPAFPVLLALRVSLGMGMITILSLSGAIIMAWFRAERFPLINTFTSAWQSLAFTLAFFLSVPLAQALGWQNALGVFGAVALLGAVAWLFLGKVRPSPRATTAMSLREMVTVARDRNALLLGLGLAGAFSFNTAMTSWLPTYFSEVRGMSQEQASRITALLPFIGIVGTFVGGALALRVGKHRPFLMVAGVAMLVTGVVNYLAGMPWLYLTVTLMGFFSWVYLPSAFTIPMELPGMTPEKLGVTMATALAIGNLANFFSPLMVGAITDATGSYAPGFVIISVMALSLTLAGYLLPETGSKAKETAPQEVLAPK